MPCQWKLIRAHIQEAYKLSLGLMVNSKLHIGNSCNLHVIGVEYVLILKYQMVFTSFSSLPTRNVKLLEPIYSSDLLYINMYVGLLWMWLLQCSIQCLFHNRGFRPHLQHAKYGPAAPTMFSLFVVGFEWWREGKERGGGSIPHG